MIKRYYRSLITLKFALVQTLAAVAVFVFAFLTFHTGSKVYYWIAVAAGIILIAFMVYVQIAKSRMTAQMKNVKHLNQYYDEGAVLGKSFFLDERMLLCSEKMHIEEHPTDHVHTMKVMPASKKDKFLVQLDDFVFMVDNRLQTERLAAFLKKRNPTMTADGIQLDGDGSLKSLKAE